MSKNKPMADNEMEKASGGQIEQLNITVTGVDGKPKVITKYNVWSDGPLHRRELIARDVKDINMANFIAEKAGVSNTVTGVYNYNKEGYPVEDAGNN